MRVCISTSEGQFTAQLKLPRSLVLSAALAVATFVGEAIRCESNIRELRAALAQCLQRPAGASQQAGAP